jgi:hypothetical protein
MGWWKVGTTESVIGDEPLDILGTAISKVARQYETAFGRLPTITEWEALLRTTMGLDEPAYRCAKDGVPEEVHIKPQA